MAIPIQIDNPSSSMNQSSSNSTSQPSQASQNIQVPEQQRNFTTTKTIPSQVNSNEIKVKREAIFPTVIMNVKSHGGTIFKLRALIDQCSESSFIKTSVAKQLNLKINPIQPFEITGLEDTVTAKVGSVTK